MPYFAVFQNTDRKQGALGARRWMAFDGEDAFRSFLLSQEGILAVASGISEEAAIQFCSDVPSHVLVESAIASSRKKDGHLDISKLRLEMQNLLAFKEKKF